MSTFYEPDGPEARIAFNDERAARDEQDIERVELDFADLRIAELEAALRDIVFSCNEALTADWAKSLPASAIAAALRQKALAALTVSYE